MMLQALNIRRLKNRKSKFEDGLMGATCDREKINHYNFFNSYTCERKYTLCVYRQDVAYFSYRVLRVQYAYTNQTYSYSNCFDG